MLEPPSRDVRNDASTWRDARMFGASMHASGRLTCVLLVFCMCALLSACKQPTQEHSDTAKDEVAESSGADDKRAAAADAPAADAPQRWTIETLRAELEADGWHIESETPTAPDVATPKGTTIDGLTIQKDDLRADLFLYHYPRAGYAQAHASVEYALEHTAILQQGAQLFAVVSRDDAQARTVLEALPMDEDL